MQVLSFLINFISKLYNRMFRALNQPLGYFQFCNLEVVKDIIFFKFCWLLKNQNLTFSKLRISNHCFHLESFSFTGSSCTIEYWNSHLYIVGLCYCYYTRRYEDKHYWIYLYLPFLNAFIKEIMQKYTNAHTCAYMHNTCKCIVCTCYESIF